MGVHGMTNSKRGIGAQNVLHIYYHNKGVDYYVVGRRERIVSS